jgi:hypothetical protein
METAEHREPYESRGSGTDLGAPGGESPPGDSTEADLLTKMINDINSFTSVVWLAATLFW